jgi:hypothetical protein
MKVVVTVSLYAAVLNLLVRLRRVTAREIADPTRPVLREALGGGDRQRWFHRRRREDPLGDWFATTWRQRLIKAAAEITVNARRGWSG